LVAYTKGELYLTLLPLHEKYKTSRLLTFNKKYRSHLEIVALIIEAVKNKDVGNSSIMKHANINYMQLKKYLNSLAEMGFIKPSIEKDQVYYKATEKGLAFLRQYYVLLGMLLDL